MSQKLIQDQLMILTGEKVFNKMRKLLELANYLSQRYSIELTRSQKCSKAELMKWFYQHWHHVTCLKIFTKFLEPILVRKNDENETPVENNSQ
jgi:ribulose kinase